jgi:hypothetical protein
MFLTTGLGRVMGTATAPPKLAAAAWGDSAAIEEDGEPSESARASPGTVPVALLRTDTGAFRGRAATPNEAFELLALYRVQVVMCDQRMPAMTGIEFLSKVKEMYWLKVFIRRPFRFGIEVAGFYRQSVDAKVLPKKNARDP